jgi:outer membrane protein assembly factor BamD (BamD/ComL family)
VAELKAFGADYALLQNGFAQGLMHKYAKKVNVLTTLTQEYPYSDYTDDAFYEIARAELQQDHNEEAIEAYQALLKNYPHSNYAAKASLEMGMTYRTLKKYDQAIETFKTTISTYIGSEEAYSALEGMEQLYVETNKVDEYIAYTKTLTNMQIQTASSEDSLVYVTALKCNTSLAPGILVITLASSPPVHDSIVEIV